MIGRTKALLAFLVDGMNATRTTDLQYRIQQAAPVLLGELDRAEAFRKAVDYSHE